LSFNYSLVTFFWLYQGVKRLWRTVLYFIPIISSLSGNFNTPYQSQINMVCYLKICCDVHYIIQVTPASECDINNILKLAKIRFSDWILPTEEVFPIEFSQRKKFLYFKWFCAYFVQICSRKCLEDEQPHFRCAYPSGSSWLLQKFRQIKFQRKKFEEKNFYEDVIIIKKL